MIVKHDIIIIEKWQKRAAPRVIRIHVRLSLATSGFAYLILPLPTRFRGVTAALRRVGHDILIGGRLFTTAYKMKSRRFGTLFREMARHIYAAVEVGPYFSRISYFRRGRLRHAAIYLINKEIISDK